MTSKERPHLNPHGGVWYDMLCPNVGCLGRDFATLQNLQKLFRVHKDDGRPENVHLAPNENVISMLLGELPNKYRLSGHL